jgi:NADH-quinone oxidoreductase subunit I
MERQVQSRKQISQWIGWVFFSDIINGLSLTLSYMFSKTITEHYPDKEKWVPYPRYRGHHFLNTDETGDIKCVACELCAKICPCDCIEVVPYEDERGNRRPLVFDIDMGRCLFCGLCEDACPADAIKLGQHYEFSAETSEALLVGRDALIAAPRKAEHGGKVFTASLTTTDGVQVIEDVDGPTYDWWDRVRRR